MNLTTGLFYLPRFGHNFSQNFDVFSRYKKYKKVKELTFNLYLDNSKGCTQNQQTQNLKFRNQPTWSALFSESDIQLGLYQFQM